MISFVFHYYVISYFVAFTQNKQFENENTKMKAELDKIRSNFTRSSTQNFQFRFDLEKATTERDNIFEAHQKQKSLLSE